MSDQDRYHALTGDLKKSIINSGFANWDAVTQATGQLFAAINATKKKYTAAHPGTTHELSNIMDLEERIREFKNDGLYYARQEGNILSALLQAHRFDEYYSSPEAFLDRNKNLRGFKERARDSKKNLCLALKIGIRMKRLAIIDLENFPKLRQEYQVLATRLNGQSEQEA